MLMLLEGISPAVRFGSSLPPGLLSDRFTSNVLESFIGISEDKIGYTNSENSNQYSGVIPGSVEEFPHWRRDNNQFFTFPATYILKNLGFFLERTNSDSHLNYRMIKRYMTESWRCKDANLTLDTFNSSGIA